MHPAGSPPILSRAMIRKIAILTAGSVALSMLITIVIMIAISASPEAISLALSIAGFCPLLVTPPAAFLFHRQTLELEAAHRALGKAHRDLSEVYARLKAAHEDLEHRANHDTMTGLANRDKFHAHLSALKRRSDSGYLLMIDADRFKQINDRHGHDAGDRALLAVANAISGSIRASDLGARIGGEEFAIILAGASRAEAACIAERLRATVEAISLASADGEPLKVTVSIGGAPFNPQSRTKEVMREADALLYEAKRAGRNRICIGDKEMRAA